MDWVMLLGADWGYKNLILPIIIPRRIMIIAQNLLLLEKLGSITGVMINQLVMAPPVIARMVRIIILKI